MSTSLAASAAPPRALLIWADDTDLYAEFHSRNGPVIIKYPLTTRGLSMALGLVRERKPDGLDKAYKPPEPFNQPGTATQRENCRAVLKQLGVIG
jgi:hypothetical protein